MAIPFARTLARFSQRVGNRLFGPLTWHLPGFGRVEHRGRISGTLHSAPMVGFPADDGRRMWFALTYGPEAQWVRNALAAGEVTYATRRGGRMRLVQPRIVHDATRRMMPRPVRFALRLLRVDDFLETTIASDPPPVDAGPGQPEIGAS